MTKLICSAIVPLFWATSVQGAPLNAAVLSCDLPGHGDALVDALTKAIERDYSVRRIDLETLFNPDGLVANPPDLLILPNASVIPAHATPSIDKYLRQGGDLIALRTPLSLKPPVHIGGKWVDKHEYLTSQAAMLPPHVLYDLSQGYAGWDRVSNHQEWASKVEKVADQPAAGLKAVHVQLADLLGWDTYQAPRKDPFFAPGDTLTVFAAKGTPKTNSLAVEWEEKDGSRWIATVPLTPHWKRIIIAPEEFRYWASNPARGGAGDRFNPANAVVLKIGLAFSHTGPVGGPHEYWLGPVGTAARTPEFDQLIGDFGLPALDTICPSYKFFECNNVTQLTRSLRSNMDLDAPLRYSVPAQIRSPHPRPDGGGFNKGRAWRWISLIDARAGDKARWRGTPATLLVHADGPYKGGAWLSIGIDDDDWYRTPEALALIANTAARIREGVFLIDGGADKYTYFADQEIVLGATLVNISASPAKDYVCIAALINRDNEKDTQDYKWVVSLAPGEMKQVSATYKPAQWPKSSYACGATLLRPDQKVGWADSISQGVHVWQPKPLAERKYVTIKDGNFILDGRRWRANGVNYMPSSGIGTEDNPYFEDWTGPRAYDPVVIQRDLENIKRIGYNSISIFTDHRLIQWQNTVDLLRRCEELGLKVNLSLRPGTPMHFQWPKMKEMVEKLRLAESEALFAYDLAWEPHFGRQADRVVWDRDWEAWIVERYGSLENAEKDWEFKAPRDAAGKITNPSAEQVMGDGPWRRMVAAYRRFLDTLLYKKYNAARALMRTIDPYHFVSFRMTEAGNPTCRWDGIMPYDFPYLVNAVDFLAPEAYGRIGDWEQVKPGWFELEYGRWADAAKPFIWAEQGMSTWGASIAGNSPDLLSRQAEFYREFYRMMIASGADGIFSWWYPGGFRWNENSDFGIINPDGSDRPVTKVIREMSKPFLDGPDPKPIDTWIEFDRDPYPDGIAGAYDAVKDDFWKAIEAGKTPGLRTAGTGTDSKSCPLIAVGNTPLNGHNPPKYLDAAFDVVEMQAADGKWVEIAPGSTVKMPANPGGASNAADRMINLRVTLTNLGEARWIAVNGNPAAPESLGGVYLNVLVAGQPRIVPLSHDVDHRKTVERMPLTISVPASADVTEIGITLEAAGRGRFGERFKCNVRR